MAGDIVNQYLYAEDQTGLLPANKITGERQTLSPPLEDLTFHFIIPKAGPYFRDSLVLTHIPTNRLLIRGIDYIPGHEFQKANFELEMPRGGLYLSILLYDNTLSGQVKMDYQTIGGAWTLDENTIFEILSNRAIDPRSATYDEVNGKPEVFPPLEHNHPADDFTGVAELIIAQNGVATAIREQTNSYLMNPPVMLDLYYYSSQVDQKFNDVYTKFQGYYNAVQIDQKLADLVLGDGGEGGYTKVEINLLLNNMTNNFTNYYTKVAMNTILNDLDTRLDGMVEESDLDALKGEIKDAAMAGSEEQIVDLIVLLTDAFNDAQDAIIA